MAYHVNRVYGTLSCRLWPQKRSTCTFKLHDLCQIWLLTKSWKWYFWDDTFLPLCVLKGVLKRWFLVFFFFFDPAPALCRIFLYSVRALSVHLCYSQLIFHSDLKNRFRTGFIYVLFRSLTTDDIAVLFFFLLLLLLFNSSWIFQEHLLFQLAHVL